MDLAALSKLYPVISDLIQRIPGISKELEKRAKKEDASFILQLETSKGIGEIREGIGEVREEVRGMRRHTLLTSIASAKLANPELTSEQFIESLKFAKGIVDALEEIV